MIYPVPFTLAACDNRHGLQVGTARSSRSARLTGRHGLAGRTIGTAYPCGLPSGLPCTLTARDSLAACGLPSRSDNRHGLACTLAAYRSARDSLAAYRSARDSLAAYPCDNRHGLAGRHGLPCTITTDQRVSLYPMGYTMDQRVRSDQWVTPWINNLAKCLIYGEHLERLSRLMVWRFANI